MTLSRIFPITLLLLAVCVSCQEAEQTTATSPTIFVADDADSWQAHQLQQQHTLIHTQTFTGGQFDITGNGALLLQKADSSRQFWHTDAFVSSGSWTSQWVEAQAGDSLLLETQIYVYGQNQRMDTGWTKFEGNPLVCAKDWPLASPQSLQLPDTAGNGPNDQSLVRGRGAYEGKWVLLFNVGGWAVGGWAMAVADELAPIKSGVNPFEVAEPFPLMQGIEKEGIEGYHAPNDWVYVDGTWYAPDESRDHHSRMWTSPDLITWESQGVIKGMEGHDPGMLYDGEYYYLFNEDGNKLQYCRTKDPLGEWEPMGTALEVGDHTGDADLCFFNNRWHMFFDDGEHFHYELGYAQTLPSQFPMGWQLQNDVFGPHKPEQQQQWDDDVEEGNGFGTGDADIALEGTTLYLTYERPVGIAFKELELLDMQAQRVEAFVEVDTDGDQQADTRIPFGDLQAGDHAYKLGSVAGKAFRLVLDLHTDDLLTSPMITKLRLQGI